MTLRPTPPQAVAACERAAAAFPRWRGGADAALAEALEAAPDCTAARILQAWMLLGSRDPRQIEAARPALARALDLPADAREQAHLAAIASILADDYVGAKDRLGE